MGCLGELTPALRVVLNWPAPDGPPWHEACLEDWDDDEDDGWWWLDDEEERARVPTTGCTNLWVRWLCRRAPVDAATWPHREWAGPPRPVRQAGSVLAVWPRLKLAAEEEAVRNSLQTEAHTKLARMLRDAHPRPPEVEDLPVLGVTQRRDCRILQDTAASAMRAGGNWVSLWYQLAENACGLWFNELDRELGLLWSMESLDRANLELAHARGVTAWSKDFWAVIRGAIQAKRYHRPPATTDVQRTEAQNRSRLELEAHRAYGSLWRRVLAAWEGAERARLQADEYAEYRRMVPAGRRQRAATITTPASAARPGELPPQPSLHGHRHSVFDLRILIHGLRIQRADGWLPVSPSDAAWVGLLLPALRVHGRRVTAFEVLDEHLSDRLRLLDPAAFGQHARAVQQCLGGSPFPYEHAVVSLSHPASRGRFALWHWPRVAEADLLARAHLLPWTTGIRTVAPQR